MSAKTHPELRRNNTSCKAVAFSQANSTSNVMRARTATGAAAANIDKATSAEPRPLKYVPTVLRLRPHSRFTSRSSPKAIFNADHVRSAHRKQYWPSALGKICGKRESSPGIGSSSKVLPHDSSPSLETSSSMATLSSASCVTSPGARPSNTESPQWTSSSSS